MRRYALYRENCPKRIAADLGMSVSRVRTLIRSAFGAKHREGGVFGG